MFIKKLNIEINEEKFVPEYKEKNIQWFYALDNEAQIILFEDAYNNYHSLLTVIIDGITNSIPVLLFEELTEMSAESIADIKRSKTDYWMLKKHQQKVEVICEKPLFTLCGTSYNGCGDIIHITSAMLKNATIGTKWEGRDSHNCGRDLDEESLEIIYKNERGCSCLYRQWGTTDDDNPKDWEKEPKIIWFELY
ncbi:MAG: hypothetical protein PHT02_01320 [Tissierellia bacterium]|nr:hypothetical protein [Tissierellia bacterium]